MIGFKDYWFGKECEGRLTDVETLFVANVNLEEPNELQQILYKAPHIYICSPATNQMITINDWQWLNDLVDRGRHVVSIEVTPGQLELIPPMIRIKCHIMYMINQKEVSLLKKNDSIKVVYDDYSLYCASIQNMQHVKPDDYKYDRT